MDPTIREVRLEDAEDQVRVIGTCVDLAFPRQAIGRRMSDVTFRVARQRGYEKVFTCVRADNGPARKQAKFGGIHVDEVIIERFLV